MLKGDVEMNPGPLSNCKEYSQSATGISTVYLPMTILNYFFWKHILHKFDIICLSETYLDSTTPNDDGKLQIPGYTLICSDHPSNIKRGGVCIYYNSSLPLRVINIGYLHECLSFELQIGDKICNFLALYRSPSQSQDDFETFADNFEMTLELLAQKNPFLLRAIGDLLNLQIGIIKTKQVSKVTQLKI